MLAGSQSLSGLAADRPFSRRARAELDWTTKLRGEVSWAFEQTFAYGVHCPRKLRHLGKSLIAIISSQVVGKRLM